ncbi:DUF7919 family protein [Myxococcus qinghaiensis]|uniref:DUF7919 family protein n=1 Tax=Myxococcus qinghaiensis TaxID=2906758 RepID=UPI0020A7568D|nr:hypothetical protein [Myxococcus qinghaiensis]MCP3163829.1 hypothetical protein [Myxococcus qinghaiensis]
MAYFADLAPCSYFPAGQDVLLSVGWLEEGHSFTQGVVSEDFFEALVRLCVNPWQPVAFAGRHECSLCRFSGGPGTLVYRDMTVSFGGANVFVPGADRVFVAPTSVVHYIDAHGYAPPREFQAAVMGCPEMRSMAYLKALKARGLTAFR